MPATRREVDRTLASVQKLRYSRLHRRDHDWYELIVSDQKIAWTRICRGSQYRTLGDPILSKICKQIHLVPDELQNFISCKPNWPDYRGLLSARLPSLAALLQQS